MKSVGLPSSHLRHRCSATLALALAFAFVFLPRACVGSRVLKEEAVGGGSSSQNSVKAAATVSGATTCSPAWLRTQVTAVSQSLNKSRSLVTTAKAKASGTRFQQVRNTLGRCLDQIHNAELYLSSGDYSRARKRVEFLITNVQAAQKLVASASKGVSWTELSRTLNVIRLVPSQCLAMTKKCKGVVPATPNSNDTGVLRPTSISNSNSSSASASASASGSNSTSTSTTNKPPPANASSSAVPPASPPPPPPAVANTNSSAAANDTAYEAYGWKPYGVNAGNWSSIIHATYYGNEQGNNTYGQCYGSTPTDIASRHLGVFTAAGSRVLLQQGMECGACYQIKCADRKLCKTDSPVTVRLTNACPKSGGTGYPWCDFPRIHFDMSKPAFSSMVDPKVGAVSVRYRRVDCPVVGNVAYYISAKGNRWWIPINVLNVGGPGAISDMWFRTSNTPEWTPFFRSWGANWPIHQKPYLVGQSISFRLKLRGTEQYVVSENVLPSNWAFGATYTGGQVQPNQLALSSTVGNLGNNTAATGISAA